MNNKNNKPVSEVRYGTIVASIWKQVSGKGTYYNVTFARIYKDGNKWQRSESFGRDDLLTVVKAANEAHTRIFELSAAESEK
jgi:hypothetical protein